MNLQSINGSDGPFWAAYQTERRRGRIFDDPDYVPYWFLEKLAIARVAAARVTLEKLGTINGEAAWKALREVEGTLRSGGNLDEREAIVLGVLGAEEIETAREFEEFGSEERWVGCPKCRRGLGSSKDCEHCLAAKDAHWIGAAFEAVVAANKDRQRPVLLLTKALYTPVRERSIENWQERFRALIRFWGREPSLEHNGPLGLSSQVAKAWLHHVGRSGAL